MSNTQYHPPPPPSGASSDERRLVELLIASADFAASAMARLVQQFDDDGEQLRKLFYDYVHLSHTLEVTFLFPNLSGAERDLLAGLLGARNALLVDLKGHRQARTPTQQEDHNKMILSQRQRFVSLQAEVVASRLREKLSRLQKILLDREFLTLPEPWRSSSGSSQGG